MANSYWQHLSRYPTATQPLGGSISTVDWQHLNRDLTATQPWVLAASQPWLTAELRLQYVFHSVLNLSVGFCSSSSHAVVHHVPHLVAACRRDWKALAVRLQERVKGGCYHES
jgi:hypothetical protein